MTERLVPGRTVTSRVLAILAAFGPARQQLRLTELSQRTGLALSTTHRLVAELVDWGALERDEDGRYRIGLRLWEVGALAPRGLPLRDAAMPFLDDVFQATGQNVQLAVLAGSDAVYVERLSGRNAVRVVTRPGSRLPLHATGVGLVLLAHAPLGLRQQVLAAPLVRFTPYTIADPAQLRRLLAEVRRRGFAVSDRQIETISMSVAAPVWGARGQVVAALSVVIPAQSNPAGFAALVVSAARGISRSLGGLGESATSGRRQHHPESRHGQPE